MRRVLAGVVLAGLAWTAAAVVGAAPAAAHPLGNFTTNTYAGLVVRPDAVAVDYVVDLAEVPTLQARGAGPPTCAALARELDVTVDGRAVPLQVAGSDLSFPPGEGGLDTLRLECRLEADVAVGSAVVRLRDGNLTGRVGWHEVTAVGDGATLLESDVPEETVSARLTDYPSQAPLDQREASLTVRPGGAQLAGGADGDGTAIPDRGGDRLTDAFTSLVDDRSVTPGFGLLAALLAVALGCLHALAPGHGKTLMAAYVLGEDSRLRQLAGLGLTVAVTHTAGVLVLGLVVSASTAVAPEAVLTGTSVASGVLLAAVGAGLLVRRLRRGPGHHHGHAHPHGHDHDHDHPHPVPRPRAGSWRVVGMGFAGGLVPSPSALVVLLGAAAVGRVWFGVVLVVAYGLGMAAALVAAGALLVRARPRLDAWSRRRGRLGAAVRALPLVTAGGLLVGGLSLAARALVRV